MSDDPVYRFLERLQAASHRTLGIPMPDRTRDGAIYEQVASRVLATQLGRPPSREEVLDLVNTLIVPGGLPTRFEEPGGFRLISSLIDGIEDVLTKNSVELPARPRFGTLATGRVNAMTVAVPGGGYLVLLERELIHFANLVSKALALAFPTSGTDEAGRVGFSTHPDQVAEHLDADPSAVDRFTETVLAYVLTGAPGAAEPYILDTTHYQSLTGLFRDSMEFFVVGHEYGHLLAGHLASAHRQAAALAADGIEAEEVEFAWRQEFEADVIGAQLGAAAMMAKNGQDLSFGFCGFEVFFGSLEVMDRAVSLMQFGDESARVLGTHPPNADRRRLLREFVKEVLGEEESVGPLGLGQMIESAFDTLWQRASGRLLKLHRAGYRPAPMWSIALTDPPVSA